MNNQRKWYTISTNIDIETGEIITESQVLRERWVKVGTEKEVQYKYNTGINKITKKYERNRQQRIEF